MRCFVNQGDVAKCENFWYNGIVWHTEVNPGEVQNEVPQLWCNIQGWERAMPCMWLPRRAEETGKALPGVQSQGC